LNGLKRFTEAVKYLDEAIQDNPRNAQAYHHKGEALRGLKQFERAIECYDKAIHLNPNSQSLFVSKGLALNSLKLYEEAIDCYDAAIRLDRNYSRTYHHKGNPYTRLIFVHISLSTNNQNRKHQTNIRNYLAHFVKISASN